MCNPSIACKQELCDVRASNPQYEGYCLRCFMFNFPDRPILRNYKTKEAAVADFIRERFIEMSWRWDVRVQDGCSGKRPDLVCDMGSHVLIIEIDENQHQQYDCSCENKRLMEISQDFGHRKIVFIRFNPDSYYTEAEKVASCWEPNKLGLLVVPKNKTKEWNERLRRLAETVEYWRDNVTDKTVEVIELFYDMKWSEPHKHSIASGGGLWEVSPDSE